jgi:hypothetical protein
MRWLLAMTLATLVPSQAEAQGSVVDHARVRRYAGEVVTVEGPVARVAPGGAGSLWFSLGRPHPSATLVVVVLEEYVKSLDLPRNYEGAVIQVYGLVQTRDDTRTAADLSLPPPPGGTPRTPYIVLQDISRLKVISRPDSVPPSPRRR